ncbi:MAG: LPS export ABC transporter permease LptG [Alphaproteobacteria bacterium]|nr:LPS export ABC transporter permease LptG [Alphaproteobacteria bacterium]
MISAKPNRTSRGNAVTERKAGLGLRGVFVRYVGRMFVTRFIGLLIFFIVILQMLDLLNNSTEIYAADGADWRSIVNYIALRSPQIASQFAPFAALLGVVATLSTLNQRSEITIMRSAGMSAQRVLRPIGVVCLMIVIAHVAFHEFVVVRATERLSYWEANDYAVNLPPQKETRTNVTFANGEEFIDAASAAREDGVTHLDDVIIYKLNDDGLAETVEEAERATFQAGVGWVLENVRTLSVLGNEVIRQASKPWETTLDPAILFAVTLKPERTSIPTLLAQIRELRRNSASVSNEMTSLYSRLSKPLATLLMPLLGAIAGYGVMRSGAQLMRAATGAAIGFAYFVSENLMLALGKLGAVPPIFGAFFPLAIFLIVGIALLVAMEN